MLEDVASGIQWAVSGLWRVFSKGWSIRSSEQAKQHRLADVFRSLQVKLPRLAAKRVRETVRLRDEDELVELLRSRVKSAGGQSAFAKQHGLQRTYLNRVLGGKKPPTAPGILGALNLRVVYAPGDQRGRADVRLLDDDDVLKLLRARVKRAGSQMTFTKQGVERTFLNKVLRGKKPPSAPSILDALNLRIVFAPVPRV